MELPESRSRAAVTKEEHSLAIVRKREKFLVVRTPLTAQRWAGLWVFPSACLAPGQSGKQALHAHLTEHFNWVPTIGTPLMSLRHFVTRFDIALQVFEVQCPAETTGPVMPGTSQWCSRSKLRQLAMPAPHRKIEKQLRGTP